MAVLVTAFYHFQNLSDAQLQEAHARLLQEGQARGILGLVILAPEGVNLTVSGDVPGIERYKNLLTQLFRVTNPLFKDSESDSHPFRRLRVDIREEIITLSPGLPEGEILPMPRQSDRHLSAAEWHAHLSGRADADTVVLDVRNYYETELGAFRGAFDPRLKTFSDFPAFVARSELRKDSTVLMYCTGGIRCEKAALEMERQGFTQVYQLEGGILNYLKEFPHGEFEGECFVFDHRAALDSALRPSARYRLCPHCGDPADRSIECNNCGRKGIICERCLEVPVRHSCSKNCRYHLARSCGQYPSPRNA